MIRFHAPNWEERALAARIAQIVEGFPGWQPVVMSTIAPHGVGPDGLPPMPRKWQLDGGNNHWLNPKGNHTYEYHYRYGASLEVAALAELLGWLLGVTILRESA